MQLWETLDRKDWIEINDRIDALRAEERRMEMLTAHYQRKR